MSAPRIHHQYLPDRVMVEPATLTDSEQAALRALGHAVTVRADGWGNMQAVWWDRAGDRLEAAADPRGVGIGTVKVTRPPAAPEAAKRETGQPEVVRP